jgi:hypothetical protein
VPCYEDRTCDRGRYKELGELFEDKEKPMLGDHDFRHAVAEIARLEQAFGLDDLAKLTA